MQITEIKAIMKEQGITQIDLAKKANIPLQTIRKIFAGITEHPRIDTVQAIEKALGINSDSVWTRTDTTPQTTAGAAKQGVEGFVVAPKERAFLEALRLKKDYEQFLDMLCVSIGIDIAEFNQNLNYTITQKF